MSFMKYMNGVGVLLTTLILSMRMLSKMEGDIMAFGYAFLLLFIGFIYVLIRYPLIVLVSVIIVTVYCIAERLFTGDR